MGKREVVHGTPRYIKLQQRATMSRSWSTMLACPRAAISCGLERAPAGAGHKIPHVPDTPSARRSSLMARVIGHRAVAHRAGEWVDEARIHMLKPPALDKLEISTAVPALCRRLEGDTFEGFPKSRWLRRHQEILAIQHTSVQCVTGTPGICGEEDRSGIGQISKGTMTSCAGRMHMDAA